MMWCWNQCCHVTKSHVAPHFNCLDLRNAIVPLIMIFASCDHWFQFQGHQMTKMSCCTSFQLPWLMECNGAIENTVGFTWMSLASCSADVGANSIIRQTIMLHLISIALTWRMQWCHWWYCWHYVKLMLVPMSSNDQKVMFHLILIFWPKECNGAIFHAIGIM